MVNCAFKSFEGRNTQIQIMIMENINNKDVVCLGMSFDKLANKYAEYLATLNAGQATNKVNARKEACSHCGKTGHTAIDCNAQLCKLRDEEQCKPKPRSNRHSGTSRPRGPSVPHEWHKTATCHNCGEVVHIKHFSTTKTRPTAKLERAIHQYQFHQHRLKSSPLA